MDDNMPVFVPSDVCLKCEGCCRFAQEKSEWRPKTDFENGSEQEMYVDCIDDSQYLKVEIENGICKCVFLALDDNKCAIYDNRPFECRLYPFLLVKEKDSLCIAAHLACPFVQDHLEDNLFDEQVSSLKQYLSNEDVKSFVKRHMSLVGEYADYQREIKKIFDLPL